MLNENRHCEERSRSVLARLSTNKRRGNLFLLFWIASLTLAMTLFIFPSYAEDKEPTKDLTDILEETSMPEGAVKYAPEICEFQMVFPGQPHKSKRCPNGPQNCTDFTSYTMVYDVTTTIEVSVTCVLSTPKQYKSYTEPVIATALKGMVERGNISEHEINTNEDGDVRQGSLLGTAKRGKQHSIYNAQLWIGQNSVMTVESRLTGPEHPEADTIFGEILSSIKKKEK